MRPRLLALALLVVGACSDDPKRPEPELDADLLPDAEVEVDLDDSDGELDLVPDENETDLTGDDTLPNGATWQVKFLGGTVYVDREPFAWRVVPTLTWLQSAPRSPSAASAFTLELVDAPRPAFADPEPPLAATPAPWTVVNDIQVGSDGELTLVLANTGVDAMLRVRFAAADAGLRIDVVPEAVGGAVRRVEFAWQDDGGPLYGTGVRLDALDGRGHLRPLWRDEDPFRESGSNDVGFAVPLVLAPRGYALYADERRPGLFDLDAAGDGLLRARFDAESLSVVFWIDGDPLALLDLYARLRGKPRLLPRWALAPMLVRPLLDDGAALLAAVRSLRQREQPLGAVLLGAGWQGAFHDLSPNAVRFADWGSVRAELASTGVAVIGSVGPQLDLSADADMGPGWTSAQALYDEAAAASYLVRTAEGAPALINWAPGRSGGIVDCSSTEAAAWLGRRAELTARIFRFDGYALSDESGLRARGALLPLADGSDTVSSHRRFEALVSASFAEALPDDSIVLARAGGDGGQTALHLPLPPRLAASFAPASATTAGGLPAAAVALLSLSTSGYPLPASVAGGDFGEPDARLLARWAQLAALSPAMLLRSGDAGGWEQSLSPGDALSRALRLRMQLAPYLAEQLQAASERATPLLRPLAFAFPERDELWAVNDAFYVGPDLVAYPVLTANDTRTVLLPPGVWYDWNTGATVSGTSELTVTSPLERFPLYLREGAIVPLWLDGVETMGEASEPGVLTAEARWRSPWVRIGGRSNALRGLADGTLVATTYDWDNSLFTLTLSLGPEAYGIYVELLGPGVLSVVCDGVPLVADDSLARLPLEAAPAAAYRNLASGSLLRLGASTVCEIR